MTEYATFDDLLNDLVREESEPTYEALVRWQERCPKWRQSLEEYFSVWMMQHSQVEDLPEIDEEAIVQKSLERAMNLLREQGRIIPDEHTEPVTDFDQMMLAAIYVLHGRGGVNPIAVKVSEFAGKEVGLGAVLRALTRLEEKSLIESWEAEGKSGTYYNITIAGERALAYARETSRVVAGLLGDLT
jgi:hypothetical protein